MAISKGFIRCEFSHCGEIAEVKQAGGKRASLYTVCPSCGTNQGNGVARQKYLEENLKVSREDLENVDAKEVVSDTVEKASIPSKNQGSEVSDDTAPIPSEKPKEIPKGPPNTPSVLLGVLALAATLITAIFATRKPTNKPKGI